MIFNLLLSEWPQPYLNQAMMLTTKSTTSAQIASPMCTSMLLWANYFASNSNLHAGAQVYNTERTGLPNCLDKTELRNVTVLSFFPFTKVINIILFGYILLYINFIFSLSRCRKVLIGPCRVSKPGVSCPRRTTWDQRRTCGAVWCWCIVETFDERARTARNHTLDGFCCSGAFCLFSSRFFDYSQTSRNIFQILFLRFFPLATVRSSSS